MTRVATRLSIVLPVYGVESYLPSCLDSLLSTAAQDIEIVAVDDRSPDASGEILDEYAHRDPRLRVLHLAENQGLGGAREAGIAEAEGDYLWFVDSDDWLSDGAVDAVLQRLAALHSSGLAPDVLVTDYVRSYPDGSSEPNTWRSLMTEPPLPEVFTLRDRPAMLTMIMSAWNKIVRRGFLESLNVSFGRGFYEDISVTYPLLLAAERISYLDLPVYHYRRQREGAITNTASPKHLDAFGQYEAIFRFLDGRPELDDLRTLVFDRTVKQAVTLLGTPGLVPDHLRREFFARISAHFRRHRPEGYRFPKGMRGAQYRLVERDAFAAHERLLPAAGGLRRQARRATPKVRRLGRSAARFGYYQACLRLPMDENLAVYAAYWYRGYACNPAAIYEAQRRLAPQIKGVWVVADRAKAAALPPGTPYVVEGTPAYFRTMATAKYLVNNVNFPHTMTKRPGSVHVQTQHGTPLKTLGLDLAEHPEAADGMDFQRLLEHVARWDFLVSPNPHSTEVFSRVYPGDYEVLETGYPRNDRLVDPDPVEVAKIRGELGIPEADTSILYAPTFREQHGGYVPLLDVAELARKLGAGHTLLVRTHYFYSGALDELADEPGAARVLDVSAHGSVEDLCLASDVLVTDYSSLMFDYAALDRPIVVYAPDWDDYRRIRGVTFDLFAEPPGSVTTTQDELTDALRSGTAKAPAATSLRAAFRARFCPYDDGAAAERVARRVFPTA
ncbi:bifunctional glycosyltransferase/CDP-glycerol:glycerophosphate glycerophosphotransferase [Phaeacidiphilus oryzae]|uniref:bifunctional glycosyltransferase/CDP-glycerol:glycerophosphate glycerophosphotransferase n=1 Tax=Phaeacidiphilus oryzae TaxID=348818 RepID=UPI00055B4DBE|nr:bifunctional glycosyltransferase family 2 protein/CDP-glycerol:glycerophosphate glycerophosphotransferase [Phaeacidiphilus oryzae]